ncbi:MAG: response regulator [Verrucomicrobiota bacterium]
MTKTSLPIAKVQPLVLIIEDDAELRKLLTACLVRNGFRVVPLNSGDEVLTTPRETLMAAECALVDDAFPGNLTGPQTVVLLHYINPRLKIFPISGRSFLGWEMELMETHYHRFLDKPFGVAALLETLAADASETTL